MKTANGTRVVGYDTTVGDVMQQVLRDMPYYRRSGGGMTLSGGEALCQQEFVTALLQEAKAHGINTAVETTACLPFYTRPRKKGYSLPVLVRPTRRAVSSSRSV